MTRNTSATFNDIDDSSDEETVSTGIKKYNVDSALALVKKHIAAKTNGGLKKLKKEDVKKVELSFMMQSLGVEMFYSERVNQKYYEKKEQILSGSQIVSPGEQKKWVDAMHPFSQQKLPSKLMARYPKFNTLSPFSN